MKYPETFDVIKTEAFLLRPLCLEDAAEVFEIYSDSRVAEYDDFYPISELSEAEDIIKDKLSEFDSGDQIRWGIEVEGAGIVGTIGLYNFDYDNNKCIIGYDLQHRHWGKGLISKAVKEVTRYGFEVMDVNRIEAFITPGNEGSVKVLTKNGWQVEGLMRQMEYFKDAYQDGIVVAILRSDYVQA